jgi:hypothetical protein
MQNALAGKPVPPVRRSTASSRATGVSGGTFRHDAATTELAFDAALARSFENFKTNLFAEPNLHHSRLEQHLLPFSSIVTFTTRNGFLGSPGSPAARLVRTVGKGY